MTVLIEGVLISPSNSVIQNTTIKLISSQTSSVVLRTLSSETVTNEKGEYSFSVPVGLYDVQLIYFGRRSENIGQIRIYEDSEKGTLNEFLNAPKDEKKPIWWLEFDLMIEDAKSTAKISVLKAQASASVCERVEVIITENNKFLTETTEQAKNDLENSIELSKQVNSDSEEVKENKAAVLVESETVSNNKEIVLSTASEIDEIGKDVSVKHEKILEIESKLDSANPKIDDILNRYENITELNSESLDAAKSANDSAISADNSYKSSQIAIISIARDLITTQSIITQII